jgi:hypothetical protein
MNFLGNHQLVLLTEVRSKITQFFGVTMNGIDHTSAR